MGNQKILIIDDNGLNGVELTTACRREAPDWDVTWLRVQQAEPDTLDEAKLRGGAYRVIRSAEAAVAAIREEAGDASRDLIVFYDILLLGVQGIETKAVLDSPITTVLRGLMQEEGRRMVLTIHSTDAAAHIIANSLDKSGQRARTAIVTEKDREYIRKEVVKETLDRWRQLYREDSMSDEDFLVAMEGMTHGQIQDYAGFLRESLEREPGSDEGGLRQKYPDPKDVLRKYLLMGAPEFEEYFCDGANLRNGVVAALKSISGVYNLDTKVSDGRPLSWGGAWLLALGVFRKLPPRDGWREIFDPAELRDFPWPTLHAMQLQARRAKTVRLFVAMSRVLFTKRTNPDESVLEKVSLTVNEQKQRGRKLSFLLTFPCVGVGEDQRDSLLGRLVDHLDMALAVAEGRVVEPSSGQSRDTSRAMWKFFLSAAICDSIEAVGDPGYGIAGGFSPMNIMSVEENTKTEVLWQI